jgi:hypothetical protein
VAVTPLRLPVSELGALSALAHLNEARVPLPGEHVQIFVDVSGMVAGEEAEGRPCTLERHKGRRPGAYLGLLRVAGIRRNQVFMLFVEVSSLLAVADFRCARVGVNFRTLNFFSWIFRTFLAFPLQAGPDVVQRGFKV